LPAAGHHDDQREDHDDDDNGEHVAVIVLMLVLVIVLGAVAADWCCSSSASPLLSMIGTSILRQGMTAHAGGLTAPNCTKSTPTKDRKVRKISWYFVQIRCSD
jgi:hypothetical protein